MKEVWSCVVLRSGLGDICAWIFKKKTDSAKKCIFFQILATLYVNISWTVAQNHTNHTIFWKGRASSLRCVSSKFSEDPTIPVRSAQKLKKRLILNTLRTITQEQHIENKQSTPFLGGAPTSMRHIVRPFFRPSVRPSVRAIAAKPYITISWFLVWVCKLRIPRGKFFVF